MVSDHFIPLESGGSVLLDEVLGGIGEVFPGDSTGDPMEEVPEKRPQSRSRNDEHLRGLSEEEFSVCLTRWAWPWIFKLFTWSSHSGQEPPQR